MILALNTDSLNRSEMESMNPSRGPAPTPPDTYKPSPNPVNEIPRSNKR